MLRKPHFWTQDFGFKCLQNFFYASCDHIKGISKIRLTLIFTSKKTSELCNAPNSFYARKSEKIWIFEKPSLKMGLASSQEMMRKPHYWTQKFGFKGLQNFFYASCDHVEGIQKVCLILIFTSVKKLEPCIAPNSFYARRSEKNWIFETSSLKMGQASS